jgi:hypothetical protein
LLLEITLNLILSLQPTPASHARSHAFREDAEKYENSFDSQTLVGNDTGHQTFSARLALPSYGRAELRQDEHQEPPHEALSTDRGAELFRFGLAPIHWFRPTLVFHVHGFAALPGLHAAPLPDSGSEFTQPGA